MEATVTSAFIVILDAITAVTFLVVLRLGGASRRLLAVTGSVLVAWLAFLLVAIPATALFPSDMGGTALLGVILGVAGTATALMFATPLRRTLLGLPLELTLVPQGLRMFLGAGFLVEGVLGVLPGGFGIADGLTHVAAAFFALMAAVVYARGFDYRFGAWMASLFGLADIVGVTLGICFLLLPTIGPHHNVMYAALFAAPVFVGLHAVTIHRLMTGGRLGRPMEEFMTYAGRAAARAQ